MVDAVIVFLDISDVISYLLVVGDSWSQAIVDSSVGIVPVGQLIYVVDSTAG